MTTPIANTPKRSFFQDKKMWFWIAAGSGIITVIVLVLFLQSLTSTTTYYVLNKDVPARTLVTPEMLEEKVVSNGGQPPTAIDISEVISTDVYTKVALNAGDILSLSNAGELVPLRAGIPDDYVIGSFVADPNDAAGGNIKRGDYVDIYYIEESSSSTLIFQRVLILDASADVTSDTGDETITPTEDTATAPYRVGIPTLYTVGLSQEDAAKLSLASRGTLYVVLSSENTASDGATEQTLGLSLVDLLSSAAGDSGEGTDNSFPADVEDVAAEEGTEENAPAPESTEGTDETVIAPEETEAPVTNEGEEAGQ